jgi:uncharacterized membrane protein YhaH (DUF805 family)
MISLIGDSIHMAIVLDDKGTARRAAYFCDRTPARVPNYAASRAWWEHIHVICSPAPVPPIGFQTSVWFGLGSLVPLIMILAARLRPIERRLPVLLQAVAAAAKSVACRIIPPSATTAVVMAMALLIAVFSLGLIGARATGIPPRSTVTPPEDAMVGTAPGHCVHEGK